MHIVRARQKHQRIFEKAGIQLARGYKTFFKLNSTEYEISAAHKN